ncbi:MAG: hypothetical protein H0V81_04355 [Solirubrobacterales bacterium]|nr:hypothetical protein [Solirubrobacterales bacterium]
MISRTAAGVTALVLGVLCALALGCGSSGGSSAELLRTAEAAGLKTELDAVRQAVEDRDVGACLSTLQALQSKVANLPDARAKIRTRLQQEIERKLVPEATSACEEPKTETLETTTETVPTESTETPETTPPPPPPETTSEVPPPTPPTEPDPGTDPGGATPTDPGSGSDPGGFGPSTPVDPGAGAP